MYFDMTYVILVLPAVIFSLWASLRVNSTFKKYSKIQSRRNITGCDAARYILDCNGRKLSNRITTYYPIFASFSHLFYSLSKRIIRYYANKICCTFVVPATFVALQQLHPKGLFPKKCVNCVINLQ